MIKTQETLQILKLRQFINKERSKMSFEICSNNNLVRNSFSVDFEWLPYKGIYSHEKTKLTAAAFCTNQGTRIVLHISQFEKLSYPNPERLLILAIKRYLDKFELT